MLAGVPVVRLVLAAAMFYQVFAAQAQAPPDCTEKYCSKMRNCAEAVYHLKVCGHTERDADNDGIPCENVCGKTLQAMNERIAAEPYAQASSSIAPLVSGPAAGQEFRCQGKRICGQMTSCAEARFYLTQCGLKRLDADGDGRPCNSLCR